MEHRRVGDAIHRLQQSYLDYMANLKAVLDLGEANIDPLIEALSHKHANPIAKALGLMMYSPDAERAIPILLDWLVTQSPIYPDVLEALVRAGDKPVNMVLELTRNYAAKRDDEAVCHLLDLACRFSTAAQPSVVAVLAELLENPDPHIRETALDAIARIGLPFASATINKVKHLARLDECGHVSLAAKQALRRIMPDGGGGG
jgi:HEAT repeat protein